MKNLISNAGYGAFVIIIAIALLAGYTAGSLFAYSDRDIIKADFREYRQAHNSFRERTFEVTDSLLSVIDSLNKFSPSSDKTEPGP